MIINIQKRLFQSWIAIPWILGVVLFSGCTDHHGKVESFKYDGPRRVKTANLESIAQNVFTQTGTIRARREIPLAFQVPGRITNRHIDTGMSVRAGESLLELDPKDFLDQVSAAEAQFKAVEAEARDAEREFQRQQEMIKTNSTSQMALDKTRTAVDAVSQRVVSAESQLALARNAVEYTKLRAPVDGLLMEVIGEPGQVVGVGQEIGRLAEAGELEVEVALPQSLIENVPKSGECFLNGGEKRFRIELREVSGSADPLSRTWRTKYRIVEPVIKSLPLGAIVRVRMELAEADPYLKRVPIAAIDERGNEPRVWVVQDGKATSQAVEVVDYNGEYCKIRSQLPDGTVIIAMGTHLLEDNMSVEAIER
jgi:RND family efflux transporter MFP subunit